MKTNNKLIGKTPFRLVYGQEAIIPMDFIVLSLHIATIIDLLDLGPIQERLSQLVQLEEDILIIGFHQ
jgi:hypothetical protein